MKKLDRKFLAAAVAGISMGLAAPAPAEEKKDEVKCFGINGCGAHAKCAVAAEDLSAIKALLGEREYGKRFGKSEAHSCGAHAKCGASARVLNWVPASSGECKAEGGYIVEENAQKKRVARKA